ncbi:glucuronosyltransferase [Nesidiocoris tenuis]|uniref:UDP-glucuronosyltransferase n=1 Tax=Nesidiocoris tenuis TaxID=355587 RepID=A0ABN7BEN4_9HEMI|nr:glucuronosyltransferase [Nesidiocoris tenuis]
MKKEHVSTLLLIIGIQSTLSAKILAFLPIPWRSHHFVYRSLIGGLAARGHQIDFYTPLPIENGPPNLNQIQVKDRLDDASEVIDDEEFMNADPYRGLQIVYDIHMHILKKMFTEEQVYTELINSDKKYDLVITEYPLASEFSVYLSHKFKAINVAVMGYLDHPWTNEIAGLPDNPSYMISYQAKTNDRMSFSERLFNTYTLVSMIALCYWETMTRQQEFADTFLKYEGWEGRPKLTEAISDVDLILVNTHLSMGYAYPKAPHVKEIGGIHITTTPEPMSKELEKFMDEATHGVIYFSLGSVVDASEMLKDGKAQIMINVFKRLKHRVVWKTQPGLPEVNERNILTSHWLPQQAILAHKNTKLFITHGGLQSMVETIAYGVPTVGMPVFFDQFKDVKLMTTVGMGLQLNYNNITEDSVYWTINEVLTNPRYKQNAKKRQTLFKDRPLKPVDEAVFWIEYVLRHGKLLQPASARMPFYQVYLLDIIGVLISVLVAFTFTLIKIMKYFYSPAPLAKKKMQ